jgi:predicted nucleic acid-binding protein
MSAECFIDTNLFIYQLEALDERKTAIADRIIRQGIETGNACISFQVVQECLNTLLRKAEIPLDTNQMRTYLEAVLAPLFQVSASISLYQRALDIQARYRSVMQKEAQSPMRVAYERRNHGLGPQKMWACK